MTCYGMRVSSTGGSADTDTGTALTECAQWAVDLAFAYHWYQCTDQIEKEEVELLV
jgi:hypothetical protein